MLGSSIALLVFGLGVAAWALWSVHRLDPDGPALDAGPYLYPFVVGCAIAIAGGTVLVAQLLGRFSS